jgi:hypothetical protein
MPVVKFTMLFNMVSNPSGASRGHRTGGWSESVYADFPLNFATGFANTLCINRAALLCNGAAIVGRRIQQVDVVGASNVDAKSFPGRSGTPCDIPQMSLLARIPSASTANTRPYIIRGIPDGIVQEGEYKPDGVFDPLFSSFIRELEGWSFKAVDLVTGLTEVESIDAAGNVVLAVPNLFTANDLVTILRSTDDFGRRHGGRFRISAVTDSSHFKLSGWPAIGTHGGLVRPYLVIYPHMAAVNGAVPVRVTTRKVGRAFDQYRGKASARR